MLGRLKSAIGEAGGAIRAVDLVELVKDILPEAPRLPGGGVSDDMKVAAAQAIASVVSRKDLHEEDVIPSVFNKKVAPAVARAVVQAARRRGLARRRRAAH
jgi:hypothetical protein